MLDIKQQAILQTDVPAQAKGTPLLGNIHRTLTLCIFSLIEDLVTCKYFWSVQDYLNFGNLIPNAKHTPAYNKANTLSSAEWLFWKCF